MAEARKMPVSERIGRQIMKLLEAVPDVSALQRWDMRGNTDKISSIVVITGPENAKLASANGDELLFCTLLVAIEILVAQGKDEPEPTEQVQNNWVADVMVALGQDTRLPEAVTGERLANDLRYVGWRSYAKVESQTEWYVTPHFEVDYQKFLKNPYKGPGITERYYP